MPRLLTLVFAISVAGSGCVKRSVVPPPVHAQAPEVLTLPSLRLAPESLGASFSVSQRLHFSHADDAGAPRTLEALLEVDAEALRLAGFAFHQRVFTLHWDGHELKESRVPQVPRQLVAEDVLRDLQLAYWPAEVLRLHLPEGWELSDDGKTRVLSRDGTPSLVITRQSEPAWQGVIEIVNHPDRYRLRIESEATTP